MFWSWAWRLAEIRQCADRWYGVQQFLAGRLQQEVRVRPPLQERNFGHASSWLALRWDGPQQEDGRRQGGQAYRDGDDLAHGPPADMGGAARRGDRELRGQRFFLAAQGGEAVAEVVIAKIIANMLVIVRHVSALPGQGFCEAEPYRARSEWRPFPAKRRGFVRLPGR